MIAVAIRCCSSHCSVGWGCQSLRCRNDGDQVAWWVSGKRKAFWFFVLYRNSFHGAIEIAKVAGYLSAPRV